MTRTTRRDIEKGIREVEEALPVEWNLTSEARVITPDMIDDDGNVIEENVPDFEPPEGYKIGGITPTQSPVVTCYDLEPIDD